MTASTQVELVVDARAALGEGPVWHARLQRLSWVDIEEGKLHFHDPDGEADVVYSVGQRLGAAVPRRSGGMILAMQDGLWSMDLPSGRIAFLSPLEKHLPDNRPNDGKCDARGRFWIGTMSKIRKPGTASLYRVDTDSSVHHMLGDLTTSNGLDWSPDLRTMYHIDTPTGRVTALDFDVETGSIANCRVAVEFPAGVGRPDGMTIDAQGMLWIAHWEGGRVSRWDPANGQLLQEIFLPAARVTSCAFGGPKLDRLYITTARFGLSDAQLREQPHAGGLFAARPGVSGLASHEFAG